MSGTDACRFEVVEGRAAEAAAIAHAKGCFESIAWVRAVAAARRRPHRFVAIRAQRPDRPDAWLFGALHRRAGLAVFESMPMAAYGGWSADADLDPDDETALSRAWLGHAPWPIVALTSAPGRARGLPPPRVPSWIPARWRGSVGTRHFVTHVIDLDGDDDALMRRARPRMRGYLRKADQLGFAFERAHSAAAMARVAHWYREGSRLWQRRAETLLPSTFFEAFAGCPGAEAWTIHHDGLEVGAALFLTGRQAVHYQASGTQRLATPLTAMEATLWAAARHYRGQGLQQLNLGASDGLDSVARFKEKFGAVEQAYARAVFLWPRVLGVPR